MGKIINAVCEWMVGIANDNSHGYSQDANKRWLSPDVDCSSFVILSWENNGDGKTPVKSKYGATYTGNMKQAFTKAGFKAIKFQKGMALIKGDVLLNEKHHTALYLGDNRLVHASSSETGGKYGKEGDNTGREVCVRDFYIPSYGWDYVLRYEEDEEPVTGNPYPMPTSLISFGTQGQGCLWLQWELRKRGYDIALDGDFGKETKNALLDFQKKAFPNQPSEWDAVCGEKTRKALLSDNDYSTPAKPNNPYTRPTRIIKLNCVGNDVKYCQYLLNQKDNANLIIDGSFGKLSKQATINFQKKVFPNQPNEWDGCIGTKTLTKLEQ